MADHGGAGGGSKAIWDCSCGAMGNWASRTNCRACGAKLPPWAGPCSTSAAARGPRGGAAAGAGKKIKALQRELDGLKKDNKALHRSTSRGAPAAAGAAGAEEARGSDRVAELRGLIAKMEALGSSDEATASLLASDRSEMARLQEELRQAKPPREQPRATDANLGELDQRSVAKQEQVAKRKGALANAEKELEAALAERAAISAELAKVAATHLAELATKAATPAERGRLFLDSLGNLKAAVVGQAPSEVAAAVQLVEERGEQEAANVAAPPRPSGAGGGTSAEPVEVLASQGETDAADAAMDDALESALAAGLAGPDGDGDRSASGFSREKIRSAIAAARAKAGGDRRSGSGGVIKTVRNRLRARAPAPRRADCSERPCRPRGARARHREAGPRGEGGSRPDRPEGAAPRRPARQRRARPRRKDTFEVTTVNGSGRGPPTQLWQEEEAGAGFAESHRAETHLHARDISAQEARRRRAVVKAVLAPGAAGRGGAGGARAASGGLGVAAPATRGLANAGTAGGNRVTCSDGRGIVAVTDAVCRGSLALGSTHLASDTAGEASQRTLVEIGDALVSQGRPRVLGCDVNAAPDVFKAKAGWWLEAPLRRALNARMEIAPARALGQRMASPRELPIGPRREAATPSADLQALAVSEASSPAALEAAYLGAMRQAEADMFCAYHADDPQEAQAAALAAEHSRRRHERFNRWVLEALEHGAGGLHAWRRGPRGWQEDELDVLGAPRAGQREVVAVDRHWAHEVWSMADGSDGRQDFERQTHSEALPRPTAAEWLDAANSSARRTGMGANRTSPRAFTQASAATAKLFVDIGTAVEEWGGWPLAARASPIAMLPKPAGGWRPIGLLPSIPRIWNKLRQAGCAALGGRSAQEPARRQALAAEAAGAQQLRGAALLIDLERAHETERLARAERLARRAGLHGRPVRCAMSTHRGRRRTRAGTGVAEARALDAGLLAGCPHAGRALKAAMLLVARARSREYGACRSGELKPDMYIFYSDAISGAKTEVVATDPLARDEVQAALKASTPSATPTKATKNPGVDFCLDGSAAGAAWKPRAQAREQLWRAAGARRQSISAATRLLAGGLLPTTAYGCSAQAEQALVAWGRGLARNHPDTSGDMLRARRHAAQVRLEQGPGLLAGRGPAAAAQLALERPGRSSTAMHRGAADDGTTLKLEEIGGHAPRRHNRHEAAARDEDLERAASGAAARSLRRRPAASDGGCSPPRCPAHAAERRDAIAGDEVLQAFADAAEASDSEDPRYSRALIPDHVAALPHSLETEEARWSSGHGYAAVAGASALHTDGSAMRDKAGSPEVRAGWGLAALQVCGAAHGAWGCAPAHLPQDANADEIMAAARALHWGLPGADGILEIRTDCKLLVTGIAAGKARCCAWDRPHLEVWREFWRAVDGFGGQQYVRVTKVKGHATLRSVRDGCTRMDVYEGNRASDGFAKKGARLHPTSEAAVERIELAGAIVAATACWLGEALQLGSAALTHGGAGGPGPR
ncbi:unnamed protein product, partial [Prorocentrum cordatum]